MWQGLYNSRNSVPPFLLHWVSLHPSGCHCLAGQSILLKTQGLVGQMQHRTAPSARGFPVSQTWTDFERHYQCYRWARSVTSCGLPCSSTTQGLLQPSHRSRAAPQEIRIRPIIYQIQFRVLVQGLILSLLTSYCCFLQTILWFYYSIKKYI